MHIVIVSLLLKTSTGREAYSWGCFLFTILDYLERSGKLSDKLGAGYFNCITNNWKHNQMNVSAYITYKCNINYRMDKYFQKVILFYRGIRPDCKCRFNLLVGLDLAAQNPGIKIICSQYEVRVQQVHARYQSFAQFGSEFRCCYSTNFKTRVNV